MNFVDTAYLVETSIRGLKLEPADCRGEKKGTWRLKIKDSDVWIDVFNFDTKPEKYYFQVMSPLFKVTESRKSEIQNDLLEFAYTLYGCSICKRDNWYFVLVLRETEGLGQSEVDLVIDRAGIYSSDIYSKFKFKYPSEIP